MKCRGEEEREGRRRLLSHPAHTSSEPLPSRSRPTLSGHVVRISMGSALPMAVRLTRRAHDFFPSVSIFSLALEALTELIALATPC